jgi:hypothetical protein
VQDSTVLLREALGLVAAGPEVRGRLEATFATLQTSVQRVQKLDASLNPPLVRAADAYVTDVHAFLRRQIDTHKARDALRADITELSDHVRSAGERSSAWIGRALELKKRMEKGLLRLSIRLRRPRQILRRAARKRARLSSLSRSTPQSSTSC